MKTMTVDILENEELKGYWFVGESQDDNYPGVDVEFISSKFDITKFVSYPRCLFEYNREEDELRVLIWADPNSEDYSDEIIFDLNKYRK